MKFVFAGGAREVGGSCIYLRTGNKGILFDAGIRQSSAKDPLPDFRSIQEAGGVDYILISHAHMDHTGSLPVISKEYPAAPIYMTPMTMDLTRILLADSLKLMNRNETEIPHYSEADVNAMMERIVPVNFQTPYALNQEMTFTFYPAGHIAGAACIYLKTPEGSVFYSGDVSTFRQQTIEGLRIPRLRPDVGLFESTYGNRLHANREAEEQKLVDTVRERTQRGGKVLIPSFALGRSQEVLLILKRAFQRKDLPEIPVYVDGMVRNITTCYLNHPMDLRASVAKKILKGNNPFYSKTIQPVSDGDSREELIKKPGPAVFVSSSGMLTGGPSVIYAKHLIPEENASIIITGYQDEEAPGRLLLNMMNGNKEDQNVSLNGTMLPLKCRVVQVGLSAHSDKTELTTLIERMSCRRVILVHGDDEAMGELGRELSKDIRVHVYEPSVGSQLNIEIRHARMQLSEIFQDTMHGSDFADPGEQKIFSQFLQEHYPNRSFTAQELFIIYTGREVHMETISGAQSQQLQAFSDQLDQSVYFTRDQRRMFLFRIRTEEEIAEETKARKPQMQDVETIIRQVLKDQPVRKLSFYQEGKTVRIISDYPDTFDNELLQKAKEEVMKAAGWQVELSPSVNHQAVNALIQSLFYGRIRKVSHYDDQKRYEIVLSGREKEDDQKQTGFEETVGWPLTIKYRQTEQFGQNRDNGKAGEPIEQNAAIAYIRNAFNNEKTRPSRIGIKTDEHGKYLELSFISPELGHAYDHLLEKCSDEVNWRLKIAPSVNQNEAQGILAALALKYGIPLNRPASYQPSSHNMVIKTEAPIPDDMKKEFQEKTGLLLKKK